MTTIIPLDPTMDTLPDPTMAIPLAPTFIMTAPVSMTVRAVIIVIGMIVTMAMTSRAFWRQALAGLPLMTVPDASEPAYGPLPRSHPGGMEVDGSIEGHDAAGGELLVRWPKVESHRYACKWEQLKGGGRHFVGTTSQDLSQTTDRPMARLIRRGDRVVREDVWPTEADIGQLVILPGGEAGTLIQWWNGEDGSECRWQVEFHKHRQIV